VTSHGDVNDGDLVTEVTLRDEALMLLVDGVHQVIFDVNAKGLGVGHHFHKDTGTFEDGLVVVDVGEAVHEGLDLQLLV